MSSIDVKWRHKKLSHNIWCYLHISSKIVIILFWFFYYFLNRHKTSKNEKIDTNFNKYHQSTTNFSCRSQCYKKFLQLDIKKIFLKYCQPGLWRPARPLFISGRADRNIFKKGQSKSVQKIFFAWLKFI